MYMLSTDKLHGTLEIRPFKGHLSPHDTKKIEEGKIEGLKETILDNLRELGNVPQNLIDFINEQNNMDILKSWNKISVISKSFNEFQEKIEEGTERKL